MKQKDFKNELITLIKWVYGLSHHNVYAKDMILSLKVINEIDSIMNKLNKFFISKEEVLEKIDKAINDLNKPKNHSLDGKKKSCCQAELMKFKEKLK